MKVPILIAAPALLVACVWALATSGLGPRSPGALPERNTAGPPSRVSEELCQESDAYLELKRRAEAKRDQGSFTVALRIYEEANALELSPPAKAWVAFRLADCAWRAAAASSQSDTTELERAASTLRTLVATPAGIEGRTEDRDATWAEVNESLGDFYWDQRRYSNFYQALPFYQAALGWWAASGDIEPARRRYLDIIFRMSVPSWGGPYQLRYQASQIPADLVANAVRIARSEEDRGRAHYLAGMRYVAEGQNLAHRGLAERSLGLVIELGKTTGLLDDALFALAGHLANNGRPRRIKDGSWRWEPDFTRALKLYRRLLREFRKGESSMVDGARQQISTITGEQLSVHVNQFFLPGSEVEYHLGWRNLTEVQLNLYPVELARDVSPHAIGGPGQKRTSPGAWLDTIDLGALAPLRTWSFETGDKGEHRPGAINQTIAKKLPMGAFVLEAKGGGQRARTLVLVSDIALTTKTSGGVLLAWLTNVETGEPIGEAKLKLWEESDRPNRSKAQRLHDGVTGVDGIFVFETDPARQRSSFFLAAASGDRQAYALVGGYGAPSSIDVWRVYTVSDRAVYRPGDRVSWKAIARGFDGKTYTTPAGSELEWKVLDARSQVVAEGKAELDAFGAFTAELETTPKTALGMCRVEFSVAGRGAVATAELFRLEEYKRPEFEVSVRLPLETGGPGEPRQPRLFALGDRVEVDIEAQYYSGGPVAAGRVEVFVFQQPFRHSWPLEREFPWYYSEAQRHWYGGRGQQVAHEILAAGEDGKVTFAFDTPAGAGADYEYTIEARVTDASRREITGTGTVRVTRTEFFARVTAPHAIHNPGAKVTFGIETRDPNGNPVARAGELEVYRQRSIEIWRGPQGRELEGSELDQLSSTQDRQGWSVVRREDVRTLVAAGKVATASNGKAEWSFTPDREGNYVAVWHGIDSRDSDVEARGNVYVADGQSAALGLASGGIEILLDKDTLEVGGDALLLLSAAGSGRWVLFTAESERLHHHEVVWLEGSVKLMRFRIEDAHVPNVWLSAVSLTGGKSHSATVELTVPPVQQFLTVEVTHDEPQYIPGTEGELSILVTDSEGRPVSVQLAVAVVDDSLSYIQTDLAGDPRKFFYGRKRSLRVATAGSLQQMRYGLLERKKGRKGGDVALDYDTLRSLEALGYADGGAPMAEAKMGRMSFRSSSVAAQSPGGGRSEEVSAIRVRKDFRETALWIGVATTDEDGRARLAIPYPDSTTRWRTSVWAVDRDTRIGAGKGVTRTEQPLIARLQAPRFFVVGDEVTVSVNLNNNTDVELSAEVDLTVEGLELLHRIVDGNPASSVVPAISIPANGEVRVDWRVRATLAGTALFKLRADAGDVGDALERSYPVHAHGIEVLVAHSGRMDGAEVRLGIDLPSERDHESTEFVVQITPSLAVTMLDALPYLIDYPYGCTEQTLSRFLPTVVVAGTLERLGLSREDALNRVFGGIEPGTAQVTHPDGMRSLSELDTMTERSLERLYDFQHADGGWSWWKTGSSDPFMTAYVIWGLSLARDAGIEVRQAVLENGARWLARELVEAEQREDLQAWLLHALAVHDRPTGDPESDEWIAQAFDNLWGRRTALNVYGRALFTIAATKLGRDAEARILLENLIDGADVDDEPDTSIVQVGVQGSRGDALRTAHWGADGIGRRWSDGEVEATAFALRALVAVDPAHELVEPAANWLIKNRRGAQWSNTRDTAIVILALNDYIEATGQLAGESGFELFVNGHSIASRSFTPAELLRAPSEFPIDRELLVDGENEIQIRRTLGSGPLYFAARATFISEEEPIPARGNEVFVRREYFKLQGRPTLLDGLVYERVALEDGDDVQTGDRIEVVLTIETKNNLEYLLFEDLKPAGFESTRVQSGAQMVARELKRAEIEHTFASRRDPSQRPTTSRGVWDRKLHAAGYTGRSNGVHMELRDRRVALFIDKLEDGFWELRYDLRAEAPGLFHALPVLGHAMYVPEVRCNGREVRIEVIDS